ncbi:MAG TPA: YbaB/EbfC family nucleoid-associated protein [Candidatus Cloacimonas acidaminovorans]|jgi:DNA-binding YbaB/EbfC family protein|nr:YbaB/EbfC family nucleoid-associated protein [Candidatus Cloacimonas sp.]MDD3605587.1 YbaB/EbfC family nucleoid-associated protein [Candidatus Cloacimonas acidaminovorans]NLM91086.1 YbaB/EbfC family nucleoid-associated protein [Candidatus Cloacimonadota bacterium]OQC72288.1 MAG: Nucleoid-associated protein [Candidatus Cloacimonetes bacterium ADurb.Bin003]MDD5408170.1 YbaB/EbfC family nucleoid-associated protein [Candidatus Cloacimonas acidaminovorans]
MLPGGKNMQQLMKQAQKMQAEIMKQQEELANTVFSASSGGGMVTVEMNGQFEVVSLKIDPQVVDPEDVEMLEDLITAAVQEVLNKVNEASSNVMSKVTGGINIPGLG